MTSVAIIGISHRKRVVKHDEGGQSNKAAGSIFRKPKYLKKLTYSEYTYIILNQSAYCNFACLAEKQCNATANSGGQISNNRWLVIDGSPGDCLASLLRP